MTNKINRKDMVSIIICAICLSFLYVIIFSFSAQDGEASGGLSHMISAKCVEIFNSLAGGKWQSVFMEELTMYFEHPIRKMAHFSEYALMGALVYRMLLPFFRNKQKILIVLSVIWVFISAGFDEFHQLFVPGRYGCLSDVLLDTSGGFTGAIVLRLLLLFHGKLRRRAQS